MTSTEKGTWYKSILTKVTEITEELGLDEMNASRLRDFSINVARDQFRAGNRSGIRWAYAQIEKRGS